MAKVRHAQLPVSSDHGCSADRSGFNDHPSVTKNAAVVVAPGDTEPVVASLWFLLKAGCIVGSGGLIFGYDIGVIAGTLGQLSDEFQFTSYEAGLVVSIIYAGSIFGSVIGGPLCDWLGRWRTIHIQNCVFCVGALWTAFSTSTAHVCAGRFIVGIASAISGIADVPYLTEISPAEYRGLMASQYEMAVGVGVLLSFCTDLLFAQLSNGWRWAFFIPAAMALMQSIGMLLLPDSPKWLIERHRYGEAKQALGDIYGLMAVRELLGDINVDLVLHDSQSQQQQHHHQQQQQQGTVSDGSINSSSGSSGDSCYSKKIELVSGFQTTDTEQAISPIHLSHNSNSSNYCINNLINDNSRLKQRLNEAPADFMHFRESFALFVAKLDASSSRNSSKNNSSRNTSNGSPDGSSKALMQQQQQQQHMQYGIVNPLLGEFHDSMGSDRSSDNSNSNKNRSNVGSRYSYQLNSNKSTEEYLGHRRNSHSSNIQQQQQQPQQHQQQHQQQQKQQQQQQQHQLQLQVDELIEEEETVEERDLIVQYTYPIALIATVQIMAQLTGGNVVRNFAPTIFQSSGVSTKQALIYNVALGVVKAASTAVSIAFIESSGRLSLFFAGVATLTAGMFFLTAASLFCSDSSGNIQSPELFVAGCAVVYAGFGLGYGPIPWVLSAEMFPTAIRGRVMSVSLVACNLAQLVANFLFLPMLQQLHNAGTFGAFLLLNLLMLLYARAFMVETRSIEPMEILQRLQQKYNASMRCACFRSSYNSSNNNSSSSSSSSSRKKQQRLYYCCCCCNHDDSYGRVTLQLSQHSKHNTATATANSNDRSVS